MPKAEMNSMASSYRDPRWTVKVSVCQPTRNITKPRLKRPPAKGDFNPPKHEIEAFARCILPAIQAFFDTEAGRREFAEWQEKQLCDNPKAQ